MKLIKLILRRLKLTYLKNICFSFLYFIFHKVFLILKRKHNFNVNKHSHKFTLFYINYKYYKNKPFWLRVLDGSYEKQEIKAIKKYLKPNMKVLEVGGSLGITSVIANSILKNSDKHFVLEANPKLIENLKFNKSQNKSKFTIINKPISSLEKEVIFNFNDISLGGSINNKNQKYNEIKHGKYNNLKTKTLTPNLIEEIYDIQFDCLICDIEGEEYNLLLDLVNYFKKYRLMIIEFHFDLETDFLKFEKVKQIYDGSFKIIEISYNNLVFLKN